MYDAQASMEAINETIRQMDKDLAQNVAFAMLKASFSDPAKKMDANTTHWYKTFSVCCNIQSERALARTKADPKATEEQIKRAEEDVKMLDKSYEYVMASYDNLEKGKR